MKISSFKITVVFLLVIAFLGVQAQVTPNIRLNQVGFFPFGPKTAAIINSNATSFAVRTPAGDSVFGGSLSAAKTWGASGEAVKLADFSNFSLTGNFYLSVRGLGNSYPFTIRTNVFVPVNKALIKAFYYNRCSSPLLPQHAGRWARAAGHPDNNLIVLPSAASAARPAGTTISAPKGWYDAGDYNLYIVNSGISTYTLLIAYEHFKTYYDTLNLNIPESNNSIPDLLDEIKWNLDWTLSMQDPNDGGVYTKKTNANFDGSVLPARASSPRYVVAKSTAAAHDFAAVLAVAYRLYRPYLPTFADSCLAAAKRAYTWGVANPNVTFSNPAASGSYPAIGTGGYGDSNLSDEAEWAATELYIATKDDAYYGASFKNPNSYNLPGWPNVRTLGLLSLIYHRKNLTARAYADTTSMKNKLLTISNTYVTYQKNNSPYSVVMGQGGNNDFGWGSNANVGNQAMLLVNAYLINRNHDFLSAALAQMDYLVGRNATTYSFITGIGSKPPMNIHHRPSEGDALADPVPGWVAGGPTASTGDGCESNATLIATSYVDRQACYTKNEVTINWNAPAVYISGAFNALGMYNQQIPTSVEEEDMGSLGSLSVYPVPSADEVTVAMKVVSANNATLYLTDALGREHVKHQWMLNTGENQMQLNVSNVSAGVYLLNVNVENRIFKRKIIVTKK